MNNQLSWKYPKDYRQCIVKKIDKKPFVASYELKFWIGGMDGEKYLTVYDNEQNKLIKYKLIEEKTYG